MTAVKFNLNQLTNWGVAVISSNRLKVISRHTYMKQLTKMRWIHRFSKKNSQLFLMIFLYLFCDCNLLIMLRFMWCSKNVLPWYFSSFWSTARVNKTRTKIQINVWKTLKIFMLDSLICVPLGEDESLNSSVKIRKYKFRQIVLIESPIICKVWQRLSYVYSRILG